MLSVEGTLSWKIDSNYHDNFILSVKYKSMSTICERIGTLMFFIKELEPHEIDYYFSLFLLLY